MHNNSLLPTGSLTFTHLLCFSVANDISEQDAMAEEGRVRRKALNERLKAKRRAKEAELERHGAGEMERCKQDADLTRLEELQIEVYFRSHTPMP